MDFIAGAVSGTVAAMISNPMDVIKTQRQMSLSPQGTVNILFFFFLIYVN